MTRREKSDDLEVREEAAAAARHWVRTTSCCNNRCRFCLDAEAQDGTIRPTTEVLADIDRGARLGRRRLVLSGGEPTLHPNIVELIRAGSRAGYERVQMITNGRMLARAQLLDAAVDAGLGEITVSVHGHTAALHDDLVGVPGAFAQTLAALKNARRHPRLIVNIDIVVCGPNVADLERIIALGRRMGVHEFDLLQIQPAGRAASDGAMLYDVEPHADSLHRVFDLARRDDLFLWTNRFPASHLEGHEELLQDPHKLIDEVRGRMEQLESLFRDGTPLRCRDKEARCPACFLGALCDALHDAARRRLAGDVTALRVDLREVPQVAWPPSFPTERLRRLRVLAPTATAAARAFEDVELPEVEIELWLDEPRGLDGAAPRLGGRAVARIASDVVAVLDAALETGVAEIEIAPALENEAWLRAHRQGSRPRLIVRHRPRETASAHREEDIPPRRLAALLESASARAEDTPPCVVGWIDVTWTDPALDLGPANEPLAATIERFVEHFAMGSHRARSLRCRSCVARATCRGLDVQRVRAFGLASLVPRR